MHAAAAWLAPLPDDAHPPACWADVLGLTCCTGALMLGLEAWSFELSTMLASYLGTTSLDAHAIVLNIIAFTFVSCPLALSIASSIRVGHLLGSGDSHGRGEGRV